MTRQDGGHQWSITHNSRRTIKDPNLDNQLIPLPRPALILDSQTIQETNQFKYLWIIIDAQLRWKEQVQRATANATKWILQFQWLSKPSTGVDINLMRCLYLSVALPKITYGIETWYTPSNKPTGYTKNTGLVSALRNLQKAQRIAALAITGTIKSTPNDYIDIHTAILPMELALLKVCHNALICLLTLQETHPLGEIISRARQNPPTKFLGPIDMLMKSFKLSDIKIETILPNAEIKCITPKFTTIIAPSRRESIKDKKHDKAKFKVYSDGSGHDNRLGAAAVLHTKGNPRRIKLLKAYIGTPNKHNTYEAEVIGAILATWLIHNTLETLGKRVSIYTNN